MRKGGIRGEEFLNCVCLDGWRGLREELDNRGDIADYI